MRVLLVEDDVRMAAALRRALRGEGIVTDVAAGGEEALRLARSRRDEKDDENDADEQATGPRADAAARAALDAVGRGKVLEVETPTTA
jgi:CheY-like chemotaxis protein